MELRRAEVEDARRLHELERSVDLAPHWSAAVWAETLESASRVVLMVAQGSALLGFAVGHDVAGVVELESIAVREQRMGLGKMLVEGLRGWARERGAPVMELEVRESNVGAVGFYEAMGFVEQGRRARYYSDPEEDAVLMAADV